MRNLKTIGQLRALVAAWEPAERIGSAGFVRTGVKELDGATYGGLARGMVTELVEEAPSAGGERLLWSLLGQTRVERLRVAIIDATDNFAPCSYEADSLRHVVWVRATDAKQAVSAADLLVRDGNYAVIVLDLRGVSMRGLRQLSSSVWHRLRLESEQRSAAVLVRSAAPFFPAVPWRLSLSTPAAAEDLRTSRETRAQHVVFRVQRAKSGITEEMAG